MLKQSKTKTYSTKKFNFQNHFYLFNYEADIRNLIIKYKFQDKSYLFKTFAKIFIEDKDFSNFIKDYNLITCVPLNKKRYNLRGYNQSDLIARELAKHFKITYCSNLLIKKKNIVAQSTLNQQERQINIKNAFEINFNAYTNIFTNKFNSAQKKPFGLIPNDIKIAIFDDIFTTGSTTNECAKVISKLSPSKIGIITIAKD